MTVHCESGERNDNGAVHGENDEVSLVTPAVVVLRLVNVAVFVQSELEKERIDTGREDGSKTPQNPVTIETERELAQDISQFRTENQLEQLRICIR